jgi:hypothetical protein
MAAGGAAGLSLVDVLLRLRCEKCAQRPFSVPLEENAAAGAQGRMGATRWRVVLFELTALNPIVIA